MPGEPAAIQATTAAFDDLRHDVTCLLRHLHAGLQVPAVKQCLCLSAVRALGSAAIAGMTISPNAQRCPMGCAVIFVSPTHFSIANAERVCAVQPGQLHSPGVEGVAEPQEKLACSRGLISIMQ